jgi:hypothetical protein
MVCSQVRAKRLDQRRLIFPQLPCTQLDWRAFRKEAISVRVVELVRIAGVDFENT